MRPKTSGALRLHLQEFETASNAAGHDWALIDITNAFEEWMAAHEYRDAYFDDPKLIQPELAGFLDIARRDRSASSSRRSAATEHDRRLARRREPVRSR